MAAHIVAHFKDTASMYYRRTLQTHLVPTEVVHRLGRMTQPRRSFQQPVYAGPTSNQPGEPPFVGHVDGNSFRLRRIIHYRNHFLPLIVGRVRPASEGSRIDIVFRVRLPVAIVMTACLAAATVGSVVGIWDWIRSGQQRGWFALFLLGFGVTLTGVAFIPETRKAIKLLADAIESSS